MKSFWLFNPEQNFPPPHVQEPVQFTGDFRLNIACTQLQDRTAYQQRKLVDAWCSALPTLEQVKYLWFCSRVPQRLFDAACSVPGLEGLYVKWSGIKSLAPLESCPGLRYLHLGSSAGVESIEPLGRMTQLRWLDIENFKRISRLDPLSNLVNLDGLSVDGSVDSIQRVESLEPLRVLSQLRYLSLIATRVGDHSLRPLFSYRRLEVFQSAHWFDEEELDQLWRNNPGLQASE